MHQAKNKKYYMLIGLPASGKSTWALENSDNDTIAVSTDEFVEEYAQAKGIFYQDAYKELDFKEIESKFKDKLIQKFNDEKNVILDQMNLSKKSRKKKLSVVPSNYEKIAVIFDIPDNLRYHREKIRYESTGKLIPQYVVNRLSASMNLDVSDEGFDRIIIIRS
jgi:predicted kinase